MKLYLSSRLIHCLVILFSLSCSFASANGLRFQGSEHLIDERTSYDVFDGQAPQFSEYLNIGFDISLLEPSHFGYIVRIKNNNPNSTYNLSYYLQGDYTLFKLNKEGGKNLITAKLKNADLQKLNWFRVSIRFDMQSQRITLRLNNQNYAVQNKYIASSWMPDICFGRSEYLIDVPSFAIRNLSVSGTDHSFVFPLNESKGNTAHDLHGKQYGHISNPVWLRNSAYYWAHKQTLKSANIAGYCFDKQSDNLYIFNRDSLTTYNIRSGVQSTQAFAGKCPVSIFLGTNFLDSKAHKLYVYEVCNEKKTREPSIAVLDLNTRQWKTLGYSGLYMQLHHHSTSFDEQNKRYFIFGGFGGFGGFGNMQYSKSLFAFDCNKNKWDSVRLKGARINPRYFSSMGYDPAHSSLYIYGGMGNESGEQVVGRRYFYDLHKIDLKTNTVTRLWEIPWNKENIVPVRSMIIDNNKYFYTLCYPEHFSKTYLKLYRFAFGDGSHKILGDSIPIRSEKIKTNASICYSSNLNCLIAIIQEFDNYDISSSIKVYTLAYPPISLEELSDQTNETDNHAIIAGIIAIIVCGTIVWWLLKQRRKKHGQWREDTEYADDNAFANSAGLAETPAIRHNSIYLFGEFRVYDRAKKDITYMFSSKLKQAFLIILESSISNGISSQRLSELLWPDKPEDKVKNSRGVTINHLRRILRELDGIELVFEKGVFKIIVDSSACYCDYLRCTEMIESNTANHNNQEFIDILRNGKFLQSIDMAELDIFKENLEKILEPVLLLEAEKSLENKNFDITLILCNAIFSIDPINDEAIVYTILALDAQKLRNEARKKYYAFAHEYKKTMGKDYPLALSDILVHKKKSDL